MIRITRTNIVSLNTVEILRECKIRFKILILEGPKYLFPRIELTVENRGKCLVTAPEKLNQIDPSDSNFETACLDKQE